jgi:hypothetical protein
MKDPKLIRLRCPNKRTTGDRHTPISEPFLVTVQPTGEANHPWPYCYACSERLVEIDLLTAKALNDEEAGR